MADDIGKRPGQNITVAIAWFASGAVAVGDYGAVTERARQFMARLAEIRRQARMPTT